MTPDEFVRNYSPPQQELVNALRALVKEIVPESIEGVRTGWNLLGYRIPVRGSPRRGTNAKSLYWGWIGADGDHAHLGFEYGILLHDPKKLLGGDDLKQVRFLTIRHVREIRKREFAKLIRQAVEIAQSKDKRALLKLEQEAQGTREASNVKRHARNEKREMKR